MKLKIIYLVGILFLFVGLLVMNIGHSTHGVLEGKIDDNLNHQLEHILEGLIFIPIGLGMMIYSDKKRKLITSK